MKERGSSWSLWLYRILALLIAIGLWYGTAADKREPQGEKTVEASVTYSTPPRLVILNPTAEVRVGVRGNNQEIRRLRPFDVDVLVDLAGAEAGRSFTVNLRAEDVSLPTDHLEVVSIDPKTLSLQMDVEEERRLPIRVSLVGEPAAGAIVKDREAIPNSALVAGPRTILEGITRLETRAVNLNGHAFTFEKEVPVVIPNPMVRIINPTFVTVHVTMEEPPAAGSGGGEHS